MQAGKHSGGWFLKSKAGAGQGQPGLAEPESWLAPQPVPASLISGWIRLQGLLCGGVRVSCLLMGLGHPALLPGGQTRLGLFPAPLRLPHPAQAWPAGLPLSSPCCWPGGWSSPGLLTHQLRSVSQALGKEAHLGLCHPFWGTRGGSPLTHLQGYSTHSSPETLS